VKPTQPIGGRAFADASRHRPGRAAAMPYGRHGTGWGVAHACLFQVSHESRHVNAHGLVVDGGLSSGIARSSPTTPSG
jgi:hypothetical protein